MSDPIAAIQSEQKRQSEELGAMRGMHMELMKGVSELCAKLGVLEVQYRQAITQQTDMREILRAHGEKIEQIRINQASNEYFLTLAKSLNSKAIFIVLGAMGSVGAAFYTVAKGWPV